MGKILRILGVRETRKSIFIQIARQFPERGIYISPDLFNAAIRLFTFSFLKIFFKCFLTVCSLMKSLAAICLLEQPIDISFKTTISLLVSLKSLITGMKPFFNILPYMNMRKLIIECIIVNNP